MADLSAAARAPALNQDNNAAAPEAADAAPAAGVAAAVDAAHNHQNGGGDGAVAPAADPNRAGAAPVPAARPRRGGISNGRVSGHWNYSQDELERLMLYTEEKLHAAMKEVLLPLPRSKQVVALLTATTFHHLFCHDLGFPTLPLVPTGSTTC